MLPFGRQNGLRRRVRQRLACRKGFQRRVRRPEIASDTTVTPVALGKGQKLQKCPIILTHPTRFERVTFAFGGLTRFDVDAEPSVRIEQRMPGVAPPRQGRAIMESRRLERRPR